MVIEKGVKFQIKENEKLNLYRILCYKNQDTITAINLKTNEKEYFTKELLLNKAVTIIPDAAMYTLITKNENNIYDVYMSVHKTNNLNKSKDNLPIPNLVLRQNILNPTLTIGNFNDINIGLIVSDPNPTNTSEILDMFEDGMESIYICYTMLYVDDTLNDILNIIDPKCIKNTESALEKIKSQYEKNTIKVNGCALTVKELMMETNFIYHFRNIFNIGCIDWQIDLGSESHTEDGNIVFNKKQHKMFEDLIRKYIYDVIIIKYDKDIDMAKIINTPHTIISDKSENIYLISYKVKGSYPIDPDIQAVMPQ